MKLNLLVLRALDASRLAAFYSAIGVHFAHERHGSGPEHFACELDGTVFEIYQADDQAGPSSGVRIGFAVEDLDRVCASAVRGGGAIVRAASDTRWGRRAVLRDPAGNTLELTETESERAYRSRNASKIESAARV
jgi:lactoylglutathione lyase